MKLQLVLFCFLVCVLVEVNLKPLKKLNPDPIKPNEESDSLKNKLVRKVRSVAEEKSDKPKSSGPEPLSSKGDKKKHSKKSSEKYDEGSCGKDKCSTCDTKCSGSKCDKYKRHKDSSSSEEDSGKCRCDRNKTSKCQDDCGSCDNEKYFVKKFEGTVKDNKSVGSPSKEQTKT